MKDTTTLLVLMLATLATGVIANVAYGEDANPAATDPAGSNAGLRQRGEQHARMLERFDVNKDGRLDDAERASVREAVKNGEIPRPALARNQEHRRATAWVRAHPHQAGRIVQHARAEARRAHRSVVARYDADGNRKLDATERAALRADIEAGKVPPRLARALKRAKQLRQHRQPRNTERGVDAPASAQQPA